MVYPLYRLVKKYFPPYTFYCMAAPKRQHKYRKIMEEIQSRIAGGSYSPEKALPSERNLAKEFQTNHETVNKAISLLVAQGLLYRKRGIGTFIPTENSDNPVKPDQIDILLNKEGRELFSRPSHREELLFSLQNFIHSRGYRSDIVAIKDIGDEEEYFSGRRGCIIGNAVPARIVQLILEKRNPALCLNIEYPAPQLSSILINNRGFVDHCRSLIEGGHSRIAYIMEEGFHYSQELRALTFMQIMGLYELSDNRKRVFRLDIENEDHLNRLFRAVSSCSAILAGTDYVALKIKHMLNRHGRTVPDDISIVGFGNLSINRSLFPELSTADVDRTMLYQRVIDIIEEISAAPGEARHVVLESHPIYRSSSGPLPRQAE